MKLRFMGILTMLCALIGCNAQNEGFESLSVEFVEETFAIKLESPGKVICSRSTMNNQCLMSKCPFNKPVFTIR